MKSFKTALFGLAAAVSMVAANANPINGVVSFAGVALLDNVNSALATQATIFLPTVIGVSGDFTPPILPGQTPVITSPLVLGATPATIWSLGGFTFTADSPINGGGGPNNTFALGATGMVDDGPGGFDPTPAIFSLATTPTISGLGAFASITANNETRSGVPDSGSTLILLAGSLLVLGVRSRLMA